MTDLIVERIEAFRSPRGQLLAERHNRGHTLYRADTGTRVARLRPGCDSTLWGVACRFGNRGNRRMATVKLSDEALLAFLQSHPRFRDRVASIASAVGNLDGDLAEADTAEERLVEEMRLLGQEALQGWADERVEATERDVRGQAGMHRQGKKNSAGTRNSARS